jgi:hypothetical protein
MQRIFAMLLVLIAGCAGYNDAMTPSAITFVDDFDNSTVVRQRPVSAASGLSEGFNTLGFEWLARDPGRVYLTAGVAWGGRSGLVTGLAFNLGGEIITAQSASAFTTAKYAQESSVFAISLADFERIASAPVVKMRVDGAGQYTVSSFGPGAGMAIVNTKFSPFLEQVRKASDGQR